MENFNPTPAISEMKSKTFAMTETSKGNFLVIDHHAKPEKTVQVFNSNGEFIAEKDEKTYGIIRSQASNERNIQGVDFQDAILNVINFRKQNAINKAVKLANEKYGTYIVELEVIRLEGSNKFISIEVEAENSEVAMEQACLKFWDGITRKFVKLHNAVQVKAKFAEFKINQNEN